ncbi:DUF3305 domain-containing protein [Roseovarius sp. D22-M7]|uniref:DUF3305 domain-containing protein n=1 Tax=Roseovarius sp. D22-M7 TaxID=3127116 RepID=UPI00300F8A7B
MAGFSLPFLGLQLVQVQQYRPARARGRRRKKGFVLVTKLDHNELTKSRIGNRLTVSHDKEATMPLGIVIRKAPGGTRWAAWTWRAVAVLPGAPDAHWQELRRDGEVMEYHAATVPLHLHHTQTEAYLQGLSARVPSVYVIMRRGDAANRDGAPLDVVLVTASPFEAQDYADTGEEIVEKVPMPGGLIAWVRDFAAAHHEHEDFKKRRRDTHTIGDAQDGIGDPRIPQMRDVYRAPGPARRGGVQ